MNNNSVKTIKVATSYLVANDKVMAQLHKKVGPCTMRLSSTYFENLCGSIVSQQLSSKAADTIYGRFVELLEKDITPQKVVQFSPERIATVGVSKSKARFIVGLAEHFIEQPHFWKTLPKLPNEEAKKQLLTIKGIGNWTADIFLIFSLFRLDVFPIGDVGLHNAIQYFYQLKKKPSENQLLKISKRWGEYSAVASWYLWRGYDG